MEPGEVSFATAVPSAHPLCITREAAREVRWATKGGKVAHDGAESACLAVNRWAAPGFGLPGCDKRMALE